MDRAFTDLKSYFLQGIYKDENTLIKALTFGNVERTYQAWYGLTEEELEEELTEIKRIHDTYLEVCGKDRADINIQLLKCHLYIC